MGRGRTGDLIPPGTEPSYTDLMLGVWGTYLVVLPEWGNKVGWRVVDKGGERYSTKKSKGLDFDEGPRLTTSRILLLSIPHRAWQHTRTCSLLFGDTQLV